MYLKSTKSLAKYTIIAINSKYYLYNFIIIKVVIINYYTIIIIH
jgi:hypothetical protein